jgi:Tfp pilus assembly protein FimT
MYVHTDVSLQSKCRLCGLRTAGPLCAGCAERLEVDLALDRTRACARCGRHRELCQVMPCRSSQAAVHQLQGFKLKQAPPLPTMSGDDRGLLLNAVQNLQLEQLSSTQRLERIQHMAASGLGVREIGRRTGFNPSTISRWLRIQRQPELKRALETGVIDVGRAVILVDAPEWLLPDLIEQARTTSTAELRARVKLARSNALHSQADTICELPSRERGTGAPAGW